MKINDIILEQRQLDELTAGQVGTAVGKGVGAVARGAGAVVGGIAGAGKAFMKGYRGGKAVVGGDNATTAKSAAGQRQAAAPNTAPGQAAATQTPQAAAPKQATGQPAAGKPVDMKAIQAAISKLPQNQRASLRSIVAKKAGVK